MRCILLGLVSLFYVASFKPDVIGRHNFRIVRGGQQSISSSPQDVLDLRAPPDMYKSAALLGAKKASLSVQKIFILSILSGIHIGFGAFLVLSVGAACPEIAKTNPGLQKILMGAFGLPFGLMMTVVGGGELFTGNTAMVTAAVLEGKASFKDLLKNWGVSYAGNLLGSLLMALLVFFGGTLGVGPAAAATAVSKTSLPFLQAFIRGMLCNWLVCMAVYMSAGASSLTSKMVAIFFPISAFIALGLEHSVANMFLIPLGILRGAGVSVSDFLLKNLLPVTLGNIFGGAFCVAGLYSSVYGTPREKKNDSVQNMLKSTRGGFSSASAKPSVSTKLRDSSTKLTGTDFLSPEALERAQAGNNFEKIKLKKDGSAMWTEIHEYAAAIRSGKINWEDIATEDMDIRVKYAGMFHRKKATPGKFMMRLRIPNGIITSDHMRYFASVVRPYGPELGVVDITTRANIQLRGMPFEDSVDAVKGLQERGLTSLMSGLDNLRNMVGSPIAGLDKNELFDTRALTKKIDSWYSGNGQGNPEWANLPRKFNIAISGSRDDFAHTHINDIGLIPVPHKVTGKIGFNVMLGGYFSIKRAAASIPMAVWIPEEDAFDLCRAILRFYRDNGSRGDRQKTRLLWLIEELGMDRFRAAVSEEMAALKGLSSPFAFEPAQEHTTEWTLGHRDLLGVHEQKQEGKCWVGVHVPVGRLSADECEAIAALADKYSGGEIRLTVEQNILLPNVDKESVPALIAEPILSSIDSRLSIAPGNIAGHVISCTGAQFCPVAIVETKLNIVNLTKKLEQILEVPDKVRIHMTGCPNSCGQVQVADIGLMGAPARKANEEGVMKAVPGVNIFVGGSIGEDARLQLEPAFKGIPLTEEDLLPVLTDILVKQFHAKVK
eukprot:gene27781-36608_t